MPLALGSQQCRSPGDIGRWHGCSPQQCSPGPASRSPARCRSRPDLGRAQPEHHRHHPGEMREPRANQNKADEYFRAQPVSQRHTAEVIFPTATLRLAPPSQPCLTTPRTVTLSRHPPAPLKHPWASGWAPGTIGICAAVAFR